MKLPIKRFEMLPKNVNGAGDLVKLIADPIKKVATSVMPEHIRKMIEKNCGCQKRQEWLNKHIQFTE